MVTARIREATVGDLPSLLEVYAAAGLATVGALSTEQAAEMLARIRQYPDYKVYVAVAEERVVGTFELLIMDNLANGGRPSGIVEDVAVHPSFQGKGIGKQMMRYAADRCREHRCYKMTLSSNAARTGAHGFYESLGFVKHGFSYRMDL